MIDPVRLYQLDKLINSYYGTKKGRFYRHSSRLTYEKMQQDPQCSIYQGLSMDFADEEDAIRVLSIAKFFKPAGIGEVSCHLTDIKRLASYHEAFRYNYNEDVKGITKSDVTDGRLFGMASRGKIHPFTFAVLVTRYPQQVDDRDEYKKSLLIKAKKLLIINGYLEDEE